jgi:hypothetical protein
MLGAMSRPYPQILATYPNREETNYLRSGPQNTLSQEIFEVMRLRSSLTSSSSHFNLFHTLRERPAEGIWVRTQLLILSQCFFQFGKNIETSLSYIVSFGLLLACEFPVRKDIVDTSKDVDKTGQLTRRRLPQIGSGHRQTTLGCFLASWRTVAKSPILKPTLIVTMNTVSLLPHR